MLTLDEYVGEQLKDPDFAKEWEVAQQEMEIMLAVYEARTSKNLTQEELAEKVGISKATINRIETGMQDPSIKTLQKIAKALDMKLKISFVPKTSRAS